MKKEYIIPETKEQIIEFPAIMAGGSINLDDNGGSGHVDDGDADDDALGKGFWDD